ncbi:MAG: hypothetical protein ACR2JE_00465 [Acidobacteriaceae bacterium]
MNFASSMSARRLMRPALLSVLLLGVAAGDTLWSQMGQGGELQQKLASVKASTAANQQRLHQYTWTETMQLTLNGEAKPPKESTCSYGPDGKVQKIPVGAPVDTASTSGGGRRGGALRQRIVEKKTGEMKDYMKQVQGVIALYVPPNPEKMQAAFQAKKVSFSRTAGSIVDLVFKDYALPGDSMTIGFDTTAKKIRTLNVQSYLDSPQDGVTLAVQFASLPDGTNYAQRTTLGAQAKKLTVVSTNSNYRKIGM